MSSKKILGCCYLAVLILVLFGCKTLMTKVDNDKQKDPGKWAEWANRNFPVNISSDVPVTYDSAAFNESIQDAYSLVGQLAEINDSLIKESVAMHAAMDRLNSVDTCKPLVEYIIKLENDKKLQAQNYKTALDKAIRNLKPVEKSVPYEDDRKIQAHLKALNVMIARAITAESDNAKKDKQIKELQAFKRTVILWIIALAIGLAAWIYFRIRAGALTSIISNLKSRI